MQPHHGPQRPHSPRRPPPELGSRSLVNPRGRADGTLRGGGAAGAGHHVVVARVGVGAAQ